jgi:hypothetical protein
MGRITGYGVGFADPAALSRRGAALVAATEVALFEKPAGAARYVAVRVSEARA